MMNDDVKDIIENLGDDVHRFSGKTLLLSGGAGFLGRHFIALFRRLNKEVRWRHWCVSDHFAVGSCPWNADPDHPYGMSIRIPCRLVGTCCQIDLATGRFGSIRSALRVDMQISDVSPQLSPSSHRPRGLRSRAYKGGRRTQHLAAPKPIEIAP